MGLRGRSTDLEVEKDFGFGDFITVRSIFVWYFAIIRRPSETLMFFF